jgi:hypothetical protein
MSDGSGGAPQLDERTIEYTEALLFAGTHDSPRELAERILGGLVEAELIGPPLAASPGAGELDLTDDETRKLIAAIEGVYGPGSVPGSTERTTMDENSPPIARPTDLDEAVDALRVNAGQVVMSVGRDPQDPVLVIYYDPREDPECRIVSTGLGGWSEGVTEPVCAQDDDFLRRFLTGFEREDEPTLVLVEEAFKGQVF